MSTNQAMTGEQRWGNACNEQGWSEAAQIIHLEGFLRDKGLFDEFAAYAEQAATEENGDRRQDVLEGIGYEFAVDPDQAGAWIWKAPTDACDVSFATKVQAVESAWADAVSQTKSIREMTALDWSSLTRSEQLSLVQETLLEA